MSKVNRFETVPGVLAFSSRNIYISCLKCIVPDNDCGVDQKCDRCSSFDRKDESSAYFKDAHKHYFIHTGRDECPKWVSRLAGEHPEWRFYCWYTDGSADNGTNREFSDCIYTLRYAEDTDWYSVTHFQIIPT